eukprot:scaffold24634_cov18-Prasinocladus_malaysianus.AAC.1
MYPVLTSQSVGTSIMRSKDENSESIYLFVIMPILWEAHNMVKMACFVVVTKMHDGKMGALLNDLKACVIIKE